MITFREHLNDLYYERENADADTYFMKHAL